MTGRYEVVGKLGENFYPRAVFSGHGGSRAQAQLLCDEHRDAVASAAVIAFAGRVGAWLCSDASDDQFRREAPMGASRTDWDATQIIEAAHGRGTIP